MKWVLRNQRGKVRHYTTKTGALRAFTAKCARGKRYHLYGWLDGAIIASSDSRFPVGGNAYGVNEENQA